MFKCLTRREPACLFCENKRSGKEKKSQVHVGRMPIKIKGKKTSSEHGVTQPNVNPTRQDLTSVIERKTIRSSAVKYLGHIILISVSDQSAVPCRVYARKKARSKAQYSCFYWGRSGISLEAVAFRRPFRSLLLSPCCLALATCPCRGKKQC